MHINAANNLLQNCFGLGQASLPVRVELANGSTLTSSLGYGLTYNTLDNNKNPTNGVYFSFGQDFAGVGGDVRICARRWICAPTTKSSPISSAFCICKPAT